MIKPKDFILCHGNSCRSQLTEGLLREFAVDSSIEVPSADSCPASDAQPEAIHVMPASGFDLLRNHWGFDDPALVVGDQIRSIFAADSASLWEGRELR